MLVVDASLAVELLLDPAGSDTDSPFSRHDLVAPPLLWSEAPSVLHELRFRDEISDELANQALQRLLDNTVPIREVRPDGLTATAWQLASELGWAKTYDAEYIATAQLLGCHLVTIDNRLVRRTDRLGIVITPTEL
jgi:predicted nucleic acid-binding protein